MTEIALRPSGHLQMTEGQDFWSPEQVAALAVLGIKGATNGDLAVFFHYCRRTQLDPFSRQIYMIGRRNKERWQDDNGKWHEKYVLKQTIQVGIDGFRVMRDRVAERTGCTAYFEDTIWYDADGTERRVWLDTKAPAACRVVLVKITPDGNRLTFPAVLRTASYMQTNSNGDPVSQWKTQPEHMIEKCCEAFATRRAFPNDFSGVYLEEEMNGRQPEAEPRAPRVTAAQVLAVQPESPPAEPRTRRPGKTELAAAFELRNLVGSLPVGPPETRADDELTLLSWLAGHPFTGSPEDVAVVLPQLEDVVTKAGDDLEEAVKQLWLMHDASTGDGDVQVS